MTPLQRSLPTGTITFLRTDIEGSTRLAMARGADWEPLLTRHHALVRAAIADHHGHEVRTEGDAFLVAFEVPFDAVATAAAICRSMVDEPWPTDAAIRVRVGLHAGGAQRSGDDYGGIVLHRTARIADSGSGGQALLSETVRALVADGLPTGCTLRDLGPFRLRGLDAAEHLFQLDVAGLPTTHPPLRGVVAETDHLPSTPTPFIGRREELDRLERLLTGTRLLTLTGPGGTGKTRLAIELARRVMPRFPDGVWFVDLSTATQPAHVLPAIAHGLGLFDGPTGPAVDRLGAHLAARSPLLILDNLEQVIGAAPDIAGLLGIGPDLVILATSRLPLGVSAEQVVAVRPLGLGARVGADAGDPAGDAAALFLDRLARARPDVVVDDAVRSVAAAICRAVDGLPLGIELAAARARSLPLTIIRDRLLAHVPLPGASPRDLPDRQQTLERTIAWSLGLLEPDLLALFGRLGVFEGGLALEQVEAMERASGAQRIDAIDGLMALADHSLVTPTDDAGEARFEMLETIRAAALEVLGSGRAGAPEAVVRARHAAAIRELASRAAAAWGTREQAAWLTRIAWDHANVLAANAWAIASGDVELARALVADLWRYWLMRGGLVQGRAFADAVLAMPGGDRVDASLAAALDAAGGLAYWMADPAAANGCYQRQLEVARALGDPQAIADAAFNLAATLFVRGDTEALGAVIREADDRYREVGDERGQLRVAWGRTVTDTHSEPPEVTFQRATDLLDRVLRIGDLPYVALCAGGVAWSALRLGDLPATLRYGLLSLRVNSLLGDRPSVALTFLPAALLSLGLGRPEDGARFLGAFEELCQVHGFRPPAGLEQLSLAADPAGRARAVLGDDAFAAAFANGRRLTLDDGLEAIEAMGREVGVDLSVWDHALL